MSAGVVFVAGLLVGGAAVFGWRFFVRVDVDEPIAEHKGRAWKQFEDPTLTRRLS